MNPLPELVVVTVLLSYVNDDFASYPYSTVVAVPVGVNVDLYIMARRIQYIELALRFIDIHIPLEFKINFTFRLMNTIESDELFHSLQGVV